MGAQTNLVLNTKSYAPRGNISGVASWTLAGDSTFGGASSAVTESVRDPSSKGSVYRVKFKLDIPKAATGDSSCACTGEYVSEGICNIDVSVPRGFTAAEREDFCLRIQGLVASSVFTDAVKDLTSSW